MIVAEFSQFDINKVKSMLRGIDDGAPRAMTRALNATAARARTRAVRETRLDVGLTAAFVRDRIAGPNQTPANRATFSNLESRVSARARPLIIAHYMRTTHTNLTNTGGRLRPVIEIRIKPQGRYQQFQSAFLIRLRAGTESGDVYGVFVRDNGQLKHLYGPSVSQVFNNEKDEMLPEMNLELATQLDREIEGVFRQYG